MSEMKYTIVSLMIVDIQISQRIKKQCYSIRHSTHQLTVNIQVQLTALPAMAGLDSMLFVWCWNPSGETQRKIVSNCFSIHMYQCFMERARFAHRFQISLIFHTAHNTSHVRNFLVRSQQNSYYRHIMSPLPSLFNRSLLYFIRVPPERLVVRPFSSCSVNRNSIVPTHSWSFADCQPFM